MTTADVTSDRLRLGGGAAKAGPVLAVMGLLLLGISAAMGSGAGWTTFWKSYLIAFMIGTGLSLGALFFVLLQHLTRSGWSVVVRRLAEAIARNLSWIWILFLPILILVLTGHGELLYQWGDRELMEHDHMLHAKAGYLSVTFWSIRSVAYLVVWVVLGTLYFRWSVNQDGSGDVSWTHRMQRWAPIGMILYALTQTFASIDWMMTLQPKWFSTMFGVYFFSACTAGFFSLMILFCWFLQRTGHARKSITTEHYHDLGKLLFAFGVVFWAYIAFSQYMLIWYANLPVETNWYIARQLGGWAGVSLLLLFGHFVLPFLLLISRWPKRWHNVLPLIACWMVMMFCLDIYWLVMPVVPEQAIADASTYNQLAAAVKSGAVSLGYGWHIINFTCIGGVVSLVLGGTLLNLRKCAIVPVQDPRLNESMAFENL